MLVHAACAPDDSHRVPRGRRRSFPSRETIVSTLFLPDVRIVADILQAVRYQLTWSSRYSEKPLGLHYRRLFPYTRETGSKVEQDEKARHGKTSLFSRD